MNKSYKILKIVSFFLLTGLVCFSLAGPNHSKTKNETVPALAIWYMNGLKAFHAEAVKMHQMASSPINWKDAREQFFSMRLAFKKISFLTDHFNPYETLLMNSPALPRAEEDNPTQIVPPQGMQRIEEILWQQGDTSELQQQCAQLLEVITDMMNEPDYAYKFRPEAVWQSIREGIITVMIKGIAGFDAPVSGLGLKESGAVLKGMSEMINAWQAVLKKYELPATEKLTQMLDEASVELENATSFNVFNRYEFIRTKLNPLYAQCAETILHLQMQPSNGLYAIDPNARSLFDSNALNVAFFSPNARYLPTPERVALGRKLFFDNGLSAGGIRSCATCHQPERAFAETLPKAIAIDGKTVLLRNTPTLLNVAYQTRQFYDSRMATLEFQVNNVVHNQLEMGGSIERTVGLLQNDTMLSRLFAMAYQEENEPVNKFTVANALGSYMRSLKSLNARFDQAMNGMVDLTMGEQNGFNLFMGKAKCGTCHFMPVFNGLVPPRFADTESEVLGVPAHRGKRARLDSDSGKYLFTRSLVHLFSFKTPTLRNIGLTAPYMHNGVFKTLEQVIDFYNKGGGAGLGIQPENQTLPPDKLNLSKREQQDLISFLHTLTDTTGLKYGRW